MKKIKNTKIKIASSPVVEGSLMAEIRTAVADYIATEGCGCCQEREGHNQAMKRLGKLLKMKKYADGSGFDYSRYKSKK